MFSHISYPGGSFIIHNNFWSGWSIHRGRWTPSLSPFLPWQYSSKFTLWRWFLSLAYRPGGKTGELKGTCSTFSCQCFLTMGQEKQTAGPEAKGHSHKRGTFGRQVSALQPQLLIFLTSHAKTQSWLWQQDQTLGDTLPVSLLNQ